MTESKYWQRRRVALTRDALASDPSMSDGDVADYVSDAIADEQYAAAAEREEDIAMGRYDDSPHIEDGRDNCNDCGAGEGQHHGRI